MTHQHDTPASGIIDRVPWDDTPRTPTRDDPELIVRGQSEEIRLISVPRNRNRENTGMYEYAKYFDENGGEVVVMHGTLPEEFPDGSIGIPEKHLTRDMVEKLRREQRDELTRSLARHGAALSKIEPEQSPEPAAVVAQEVSLPEAAKTPSELQTTITFLKEQMSKVFVPVSAGGTSHNNVGSALKVWGEKFEQQLPDGLLQNDARRLAEIGHALRNREAYPPSNSRALVEEARQLVAKIKA